MEVTLSPLEQSIEDMKLEIAASEESEKKDDIKPVEEPADTAEEVADEPADDEDDELPEKPTNADFARQRLKAKEERTARIELEKKLAYYEGQNSVRPAVETPKVEQQQPEWVKQNPFDVDYEPENHKLWYDTRIVAQANEETQKRVQHTEVMMQAQIYAQKADRAEADAASKLPDYNDMKQHIVTKETESLAMRHGSELRRMYPHASEAQIEGFLKTEAQKNIDQFIIKSAVLGNDLAEDATKLAKVYGYTPKTANEDKPDLTALKNNKRKSGSLIGTSGKSATSDSISIEEAAELSIADYSRLDKNKIRGYSA